MSIEDRSLKLGTILVARYKKQDFRCTVVEGEDGKPIYRVHGGKDHTSPSSAGSAVMGGVACNGWRFWSVEGTAEPKQPRAKGKAKAKAKAKSEAKAEKPIKCGDCSRKFPNSREAADHMRDEHNSPEAKGSNGK